MGRLRQDPPLRRGQEAEGPPGPGPRHHGARARDGGALRRRPPGQDGRVPGPPRQRARTSTTCSSRRSRWCARPGRRVLGQRHYDVQLIGGAALHFGWIAEMKTGEGKTLVSTLPAYLNGLGGKGTHLITVNEYLARRDSEWMGRLHRWLGLEVGPHRPRRERSRPQAAAVRRRHHLRHQQRVRLRLPPRQHGHVPRPGRRSAATATPSSTRSTRSSSTRPARR